MTVVSPLTITLILCGFVDLDFVGDLDKRRSTSSYVFTLTSGAISRMSKIQETVVLSSFFEILFIFL